MSQSPDFSTFQSRLRLKGALSFSTGMRIGAGRTGDVDESDLPILRDTLGRAYIPGSSFKGALRSYIESVLRAIQENSALSGRNLACLSVGKPEKRSEYLEKNGICLTQDEVSLIKNVAAREWNSSPAIPPALRERLRACVPGDKTDSGLAADCALRALSCWTCRVYGAPWLASKVLIRDLPLSGKLKWPVDIRDGVAIDRDAGRAASGMKYTFEALPAGAAFDLEIMVENASDAELGLLWLGLSAFERGEVPLGGARSRGLGACQLALDWPNSQFMDQSNLLAVLFAAPQEKFPVRAEKPIEWVRAFKQAIGA